MGKVKTEMWEEPRENTSVLDDPTMNDLPEHEQKEYIELMEKQNEHDRSTQIPF